MLRTIYQHRNLCFKSHRKNKSRTYGTSGCYNYHYNNDNNHDHHNFAGWDTSNYYQCNNNSSNNNNTNYDGSPTGFSISGT